MGEHLTCMLHQQLQDVVFPGRKLHLCPLDLYEAADAVDDEMAGDEGGRLALLVQAMT